MEIKRYSPRNNSLELLDDLARHIHTIVKKHGMTEELAHYISQESADLMATHWGGQNIYFPMGIRRKLSTRDAEIYAKFNGINHSELVREYGVSLQWLYRILERVHEAELDKRQTKLFK